MKLEELKNNIAKTPWKVISTTHNIGSTGIILIDKDSRTIADDETYYPHPISQANARYIAHVVNHWDEILALLNKVAKTTEFCDVKGVPGFTDDALEAQKLLDKVNDVAEIEI